MLNELTVIELRDKIRSGEAGSVEALQCCLDRIRKVDPAIRAFLSLDEEDALRQAREADAKRAAGDSTPPLLGVPVAIKDVLAVKGQPLGCASKMLSNFRSPYDATVVSKLKEAGAVVFGRLNMDEFAMGSSTENSAFQSTRNPWDTDRVPGGSSGGSAAAVAARECAASIGSDTGGSIRQPASFCGCVGLKPTYGRVSRYGLVAFASSLDQIGPFARTVEDAALLLEVLSGHDPRDSTSVPQAAPRYSEFSRDNLKGIRLGLPKEYMVDGMDAEVRQCLNGAVKQLTELGAQVEEISLPHTEFAIAAYYIIATAEASANLARFDGVRYGLRVEGSDPMELYKKTRGQGFGPEVKRRIILGTYVLSSGYYDAYYLKAQKVRTLIREDFSKAFEKVDALITPTTPTPAFKAGEKTGDPLEMYLSDIFTISANLAGNCGISVPCGFTQSPRLPVGMQILGKPFDETTLIQIASAYQSSTDWHKEAPPL